MIMGDPCDLSAPAFAPLAWITRTPSWPILQILRMSPSVEYSKTSDMKFFFLISCIIRKSCAASEEKSSSISFNLNLGEGAYKNHSSSCFK